MEYRGIWVVFLTVLFLLGAAVSVIPTVVVRLPRPNGDLPSANFLKVWRAIGVIVAVGSLVQLVAVLGWGKLVR